LISAALDSFFMCTTTRHDSVGRYLSLFFFSFSFCVKVNTEIGYTMCVECVYCSCIHYPMYVMAYAKNREIAIEKNRREREKEE
jgi:hypothetical protein